MTGSALRGTGQGKRAMGLSNSRGGAAGLRRLARAALLLVPLALAACGSVAAGSSGPAAAPVLKAVQPGALCADQAAVNHLVVRRSGQIGHVGVGDPVLPRRRFTFPAVVTITSAADARAVARALCALPLQPAGIVNCPADLGITYQLRFAAGGTLFRTVSIQSTGCEIASGFGKPRTISSAPGFWSVLSKGMRLESPAGQQAFRGTAGAGKHCAPASTQMTQTGNCPGKNQPG
jgi:hypothetical protein